MPLPKIKILQIGDLHLPTVINERKSIDDKDKAFSVGLKEIVSTSPTKVVFKKLFELISSGEYDSVLFMGDLTDRGDLNNFNNGVSFLANSLQLGAGRLNQDQAIGIVPGNHDINRALASKPDMSEKFRPLSEALNNYGLPQLPVSQEQTIQISKDSANAKVILLNSCWGCGAKEFIPERFRHTIFAAIEESIGSGADSDLSQYYDRQLDTPAFSSASVGRVSQARSTTPEDTIEVYVAHHNLLPQRTTRLAPYTELVNSGSMRSVLTSGSKPTIYLHGHIHEDPVEIMSVPGGSNLVSISAPLSSDGFNEIELAFTQSGIPLSCVVGRWRFDSAGVLQRDQQQIISLVEGRRRSRGSSLPRLLSFILSKGEVYWSDIQHHDPAFYEEQTDELLQEALEMLYADRTIVIENRAMSHRNWIVRSNV